MWLLCVRWRLSVVVKVGAGVARSPSTSLLFFYRGNEPVKVRSDEYDEKDDDERRMTKRRGAERKGRRNKLKHGRSSSSSRIRRHHHANMYSRYYN